MKKLLPQALAGFVFAVLMIWMAVGSERTDDNRNQMKGSCDTVCALQDFTGSEYDGECWCERSDGPGRVVRVKVEVPTTKGTP